jgi:hypothetical protein
MRRRPIGVAGRRPRRVPERIIFLDIDGVLNCSKTSNPRELPYIVDKRLLARFKKLLERTGAGVVLSSSWRVDPVGRYAAQYWGIPFIDVCPDLPNSPRRTEVLRWLRAHPSVKRFAVIDDQDDELDALPLFQPSAKTGLTMALVNAVEAYLKGKTDATVRSGAFTRFAQNAFAVFKRDKD